MPKFYCDECGYGTEYSSTKPSKCTKCGHSFGRGFVLNVQNSKKENVRQEIAPIIGDPEFPDPTPPNVEPVSREELSEIEESLAANQSFNLRDILQEGKTTNKRKPKKSRKK